MIFRLKFLHTCITGVSVAFLSFTSAIHAETLYHETFDKDGLEKNNGVGGGAVVKSIQAGQWSDNGNGAYVGSLAGKSTSGALLLSKQAFRSEHGFTMNVRYYCESKKPSAQLSLGLISSETNFSSYKGGNPFHTGVVKHKLYGLGVSIIDNKKTKSQGMYFSNSSVGMQLDHAGTRVQFSNGRPTVVTIEIEKGGYWCYRIDGIYEASGVLPEGIDLTKSYHVAVYAAGDEAKILESIRLDKGYAAGERAYKARGTWSGGMGLDKIKDLKTMDSVQVRLTDGAALSAAHWAPHKLLEKLWGGDVDSKGNPVNLCVPRWGDLTKNTPDQDAVRKNMLDIRAAGYKVKAYMNCQNFNGVNNKEYEVISQRWKDYCDSDPKVVAFVNSQPFHKGIWDKKQKKYVDATAKFPNRKYMFCYAEFVIKDFALRYGDIVDTWIFDSAGDINAAGDVFNKGLIEEQRLYQAFAKAVHAGNPKIALSFNNGRSTFKAPSFPFAVPTHYDDYTFGHAFGGNNSHASKEGGTFARNYLHVKKMAATNGFVFTGGKYSWDDKIIGNMHSKLATTSWKSGPKLAWEEVDFLKWNLEALKAGGIMTWGGSATSKKNRNWVLRPWAYKILKSLDDHLAKHQFPNTPNWARAYTVLPEVVLGKPYKHTLVVGEDLWDPEGDEIVSVIKSNETATWLRVTRDSNNPNHWVLHGDPAASTKPGTDQSVEFTLEAKDSKGNVGSRKVTLKYNGK